VDTVARRLALGRSKAYALVRRAGILRDLDGALRVEEIELINWLRTTRRFEVDPDVLGRIRDRNEKKQSRGFRLVRAELRIPG
jgi:hypothetical protein